MYFKFRVAISMGGEKHVKQPRTDCVQGGIGRGWLLILHRLSFFNYRCLLILQKKQLELFLVGVSRNLLVFKKGCFALTSFFFFLHFLRPINIDKCNYHYTCILLLASCNRGTTSALYWLNYFTSFKREFLNQTFVFISTKGKPQTSEWIRQVISFDPLT